jgi:hypothetical protein
MPHSRIRMSHFPLFSNYYSRGDNLRKLAMQHLFSVTGFGSDNFTVVDFSVQESAHILALHSPSSCQFPSDLMIPVTTSTLPLRSESMGDQPWNLNYAGRFTAEAGQACQRMWVNGALIYYQRAGLLFECCP